MKAEFVSFNGYGTGHWCLCFLLKKERKKELPGPLNSSVLGLSLDRVLQFWVFHLITLHTYARWDSSSRSQGQGCLQSRSIYTYTDNDYSQKRSWSATKFLRSRSFSLRSFSVGAICTVHPILHNRQDLSTATNLNVSLIRSRNEGNPAACRWSPA